MGRNGLVLMHVTDRVVSGLSADTSKNVLDFLVHSLLGHKSSAILILPAVTR